VWICWTEMLVSERHSLHAVLAVRESTVAEVGGESGRIWYLEVRMWGRRKTVAVTWPWPLARLRVGASPLAPLNPPAQPDASRHSGTDANTTESQQEAKHHLV
jgi:hypothetical protein